MNETGKQLSNPFATGGGGGHFEAHVQASFVVLMLAGGFAPCMPNWPIKKVKLQGKFDGYDTDDLIVFVERGGQTRKILGQIKHSISITESNKIFGEVIQAAWSDFNNDKVFTKDKDAIALITGPLSTTDINDTRTILEWARHSASPDELIEKVEKTHFSSKGKQNKLQAFKNKLQKANGDKPISDEILFEFLKHFHLLSYDLDIKAGVTLSLLHSLIGQYSSDNSFSLWTQIVDEVQSANKNAGMISLENLPDELRTVFTQREYTVIPNELSIEQPSSPTSLDWSQFKYAAELVVVNLLGSWDEQNEADLEIVNQLVMQLTNENYSSWIVKIRETLQHTASPLSLNNGKWSVVNRNMLWQELGTRLFDEILNKFQECVVSVLIERNPQFELPIETRHAALLYEKRLKYSPTLRKGLAESLALLANKPQTLTNCSLHKPEAVAIVAVREIFSHADWMLWASLDNLLPILAEAAPDEFLKIVESAVQESPCPFDELFLQESSGIWGGNYLTGLLWALETLAWDEQYLVRVCVILGEVAARDPGGNWANRPDNSLATILLPWLPQTTASIEKRNAALQTLRNEVPEVAWKLLLSLLPNQHQVSFGSHKPSWRNMIPDDWEKGVTQQEYWEQVSFCARLAVSIASNDIEKLPELIEHLDDLPQPSFDELLDVLSSEAIISKPEDEQLVIWNKLTDLISKHRRFSDANWALSSELVSKVEGVAAQLAPVNPFNLHHRLFSNRDFDLYDENHNWEQQSQNLEKRRQAAIEEILASNEIEVVIQFADSVESPLIVGQSLGAIAPPEIDNFLLPTFLVTENNKLAQFIGGYIWSRQHEQSWAWVDGLDRTGWSIAQLSHFLCYLPFTNETWNRATTWLGNSEMEYWVKTNVNPYQAQGDLVQAIDKLLEYERPNAAVSCLFKMHKTKHILDKSRIVKALLAAVSSPDPSYSMDTYEIVELIKALQNDSDTNPEDLFHVEWAYLPLLDRHRGALPKLLEHRLASNPSFFCDVIRLIYRSKKEDSPQKEPSENEKKVIQNAWDLLHKWQTPPGTESDDSFSEEHFTQWLASVKDACTESGHLEVALTHIGKVLIHCPPDPQGLWINQTVAYALNTRDVEKMRNGFRSGLFNARGAHTVDPTGKPEKELAEQYRQKAEAVENAGYQRFAVTLRSLAEAYEHDAERIVAEHAQYRELSEEKSDEVENN